MGIRTSEDDDIVSRHVGGDIFLWDVFVVVIDVGVGGKGRISSATSAIIFSPRVRRHSSPPSPRLLGTLTYEITRPGYIPHRKTALEVVRLSASSCAWVWVWEPFPLRPVKEML